MGEQRKTIRVSCSVVRGIELRLFDRTYDDDTASATGRKQMVPTGASVTLRGPSGVSTGIGCSGDGAPVITDVDAEFWAKWLEANKDDHLVTSGAVRVVADGAAP